MTDANSDGLGGRLQAHFGARLLGLAEAGGETTIELAPGDWDSACRELRDAFGFEQLVDLCGVDYLGYGEGEWDVSDVSAEGFSRGVEGIAGPGRFRWEDRPAAATAPRRYAVVAHLLSVSRNLRLRIRCFAPDDALPVVPSLCEVWPGVNWFEREAFDLYGVVFEGHPDLRRILTDYGFIGHPFRKDFPLIGNVEVRYDPEKGRVVYEPVTSVEPRVGVPRVVRDDARFETARAESVARRAAGD
ncbi:MAG: NADH-quinone oxidoreductase subunit C [Xanthomonadales bacterium]|nr:NADH-quinone oxidoreductase subunit C [Xanthomonadales bacterium]